jgi:thiamine biosynthesis protein ThiI
VNYEIILVRYGEIALKGKQSRKIFENYLVQNIRNAFEKKSIHAKITKEWGRIFIFTKDIDKSVNVLKKIFGITSISPAILTEGNLESISKLAVEIAGKILSKKKSFAVRARRTGMHDFTSQDIAIKIGSEILKATDSNVDLNNPDFELFIEVRGNNAYLFIEKIIGVGGLPLGSQGRICSIIDSNESILASWYLMKRGCNIFFVKTKPKLSSLNKFIEDWFAKPNVLVLNQKDDYYEKINNIAFEKNCIAVSVGLSLFDQSSKVAKDIKLLKKKIQYPILHPLITMKKEEIFEKSSEIGLIK